MTPPIIQEVRCEYRPGRSAFAYLLLTRHSTVLIDTGVAHSARTVIPEALVAHGRTVEDLTHILLTHGHWDHAGGAALLKGKAQLFLHPADAPLLQGPRAHLEGYFLQHLHLTGQHEAARERSTLLSEAMSGYPQIDHLQDQTTLDFGDVCLEVMHTPGHSAGHVVFWCEANGHLFTGDVVQGLGPEKGVLPIYEDVAAYRTTLRNLGGLRPRHVHTGHQYHLAHRQMPASLSGLKYLSLLNATRDVMECMDTLMREALATNDSGFLETSRRAVQQLLAPLALDASGLPVWSTPALLSHYLQNGGTQNPEELACLTP